MEDGREEAEGRGRGEEEEEEEDVETGITGDRQTALD